MGVVVDDRAREKHAEPPDDGGEQREDGADGGKRTSDAGGAARVVGDVREHEDERDEQKRLPEFAEGGDELTPEVGGLEARRREERHDDGEQDGRAGRADGREVPGAGDGVTARERDLSREPGDGELNDGRRERAVGGEELLEGGDAPHEDEAGEDVEGAPGDGDLAHAVALDGRSLSPALAEDSLRLPHAAEGEEGEHGGEAGAEVGELRPEEPEDGGLHSAEDDTHHERGGPGLAEPAPAVEDDDKQERHEERQRLQKQHHHARHLEHLDACDLRADDDGDADGTVGAGSDVRDERQHGGFHGLEAELHEQGGADRDGHAEAGRPLEEGAKREADEQHLDALVGRDT